ncbi:hypothetical protein [Sphingomonas abietis]|uniref:Uncharacterized protein n=1 Tax=Sphingomonas abietis TaxID=3012344 RepID=A0ABY7NMU2_9SPHN|nr:hypothetical protein [Sphingomonas abietis]WBO22839.1 hypothetical protein PBT88_01410 [Sphingomonas abietis]
MIDEIDLVALIADHTELGRLCAELEGVADALPSLPAADETLRLRTELEYRLPLHEARERALLHSLFDRSALYLLEAKTMDHIRYRGASRVVEAQDLAAMFGPDMAASAIGMLGYMLRGFFDGCRADMAFVELAILHFSASRLTPAARALLHGSLMQHCRP